MKEKQEINCHFLIAFIILNTICLDLVLSALSFSVHYSLLPWYFPLSVCGSTTINYFACRNNYVKSEYISMFAKTTCIFLTLVVLSIALGILLYDVSWDGPWYHQEAIIRLKEGWNPFYSQLTSAISNDYTLLQINHFAKGAEIVSATIYSFSKKIEAGKATNILLLFSSFCLCVSLLSEMKRLSVFKKYLISCVVALNPVAVNQLFTYYVDGQLASLLCCLLAVGCLLFTSVNRYEVILLCSIVIITVNTKLTGLVFVGVFIIGLLIVMLFNSKEKAREICIAAALSLTIGVGLVGYNPYITNTIHHRNPFYPVAGKGKVDIMVGQAPAGLLEKSRFEKLLISTFSHPDNIASGFSKETPKLKVPFIFYKGDISNSVMVDARIGGFGFLFEEIILLSAGLLGIILYRGWAKGSRDLKYLIYILGLLLLSVFMIPEAWWARFVPQLWFVPVIILVSGELVRPPPMKYLRIAVYLLLVVNCATISVLCFKKDLKNSARIDYQLAQFAAAGENMRVDFGLYKSLKTRFDEHKIKYTEGNIEGGKGVIYIEGSCGFAKVEAGNVPEDVFHKPLIMKLLQNLKAIKEWIVRGSSPARPVRTPTD